VSARPSRKSTGRTKVILGELYDVIEQLLVRRHADVNDFRRTHYLLNLPVVVEIINDGR